jgi:hypothetical protein
MTKARDLGDVVSNAAWTSYTPTFTGLTIGNGTVVAKYKQVGKIVTLKIRIVLGSTSSMANMTITLPISATNDSSEQKSSCTIADAGTAYYMGFPILESGKIAMYVANASVTYVSASNFSSTIPMTWTTNDSISINFIYEAA